MNASLRALAPGVWDLLGVCAPAAVGTLVSTIVLVDVAAPGTVVVGVPPDGVVCTGVVVVTTGAVVVPGGAPGS